MTRTSANNATQNETHTMTLDWVRSATTAFIHADEMREAVSLALASGLNVMFSGPGGHGKSEFLSAVFCAIQDVQPFVKSFGQSTTAEELYGGIDLDALNRLTGASIQYHTDNSFLPSQVAIFEELFDAPARMLTFLKDTLTARELRNGAQRVRMMTSVIAAATNHSPQDIAEAGPAVAALVERFPIQLCVRWQSYSADAFINLFETVEGAQPGEDAYVKWCDIERLQISASAVEATKVVKRVLANVLAELRREKVTISPRTAMMALRLVRAAAAINNRRVTDISDVRAISYLPGCQDMVPRILELIEEMEIRFASEAQLEAAEELLADLREQCETVTTAQELQSLLAETQQLSTELHSIRIDASLANRMRQSQQGCSGVYRRIEERLDEFQRMMDFRQVGIVAENVKHMVRNYRNMLGKTNDTIALMQKKRKLEDQLDYLVGLRADALQQRQIDDAANSIRALVSQYDSKIVRSRTRQNGWNRPA